MCSTWTSELEIKTLTILADALEAGGSAQQVVARCRALTHAAQEALLERLLGISRRADRLEIDPEIPAALDGASAEVPKGEA